MGFRFAATAAAANRSVSRVGFADAAAALPLLFAEAAASCSLETAALEAAASKPMVKVRERERDR